MLPTGWRESTLAEVATLSSGGTPEAKNPEYYDGDIPWAVIGDLNDGVVRSTARTITQRGLDSSSAKVVPVDTILLGMYGSIGKLGLAGVRLATNQAIATIRAGDQVDPRYLFYYLLGQRRDLDRQGKGATQRNISQTVLKPWPIRFPDDIDEQRRIVELLENHLSRLATADAGLERASRLSGVMIQSALSAGLRGALVEDDVSEGTAHDLLGGCPDLIGDDDEHVWDVPDTWAWARLGDVFEVNIGATPSRAVPDHWAGDLPWVSSGEVAFGRISSTREHITREAAGNPLKRIHPAGTVMLAMIGEGKTRGQAAILDVTAAHNQNCASIRVSATAILPEYIYGYLEERYIETRRGGAGAQQPALNKGSIQRFPVPIAPLGTQRRLVEAWDSVRDAASRLRGELEVAERRRDSLRRSLLTAAFSGQLTTEMATA